jgi:prepilin-type N-terminal cleavage/methylation domain-containing protein
MGFPGDSDAQVSGERHFTPTFGRHGFTLLEVMAAIGITAILGAVAIPMWRASSMNIVTARRMVLANLRLARTNAITKSLHYQVSFPDAGHVALSAMRQEPADSGTWVVDTADVQTSALPAKTQVPADSLSTVVEFNTRGMVANASTVVRISLTDASGNTKSFQVWPSGQINET